MPAHRIVRTSVGLLALGMLASLAVPAMADEQAPLKIDPGLWEITTTGDSGGDIQVTEEQMARMSPEQQAKVKALVEALRERARRPHVFQECLTAAQITEGLKMAPVKPNCTRTIVSSSAQSLVVHQECAGDDAKRMDTRFEAPDPSTLHGTVDMAMMHRGHMVSASGKVNARRLGADCGGVAPNKVD